MPVVHVRAALAGSRDPAPARELLLGLARELLGRDDVRLARACPGCGSDRHGPHELVVGSVHGLAWGSLSRADGIDVAAVSTDGRVGVDVEASGAAGFDGFGVVALHPDERADGAREQTTTWVRKEALLKAAGLGLQEDLRRVRLGDPGAPPVVLEGPPATLADVDLGPAWTAAAAVLGRGPLEVRVGWEREKPGVSG